MPAEHLAAFIREHRNRGLAVLEVAHHPLDRRVRKEHVRRERRPGRWPEVIQGVHRAFDAAVGLFDDCRAAGFVQCRPILVLRLKDREIADLLALEIANRFGREPIAG